jgi:hypothetical protein
MGYWTERDLPFYYGLARTFPVADRWFSSCLGPTFPNRRFLIAGTAHGLIDDSPYDLLDYPPAGTIFDLLTRYGISWANYHPVPGDRRTGKWAHYPRHKKKMARRRLLSLACCGSSRKSGICPRSPRATPRPARRWTRWTWPARPRSCPPVTARPGPELGHLVPGVSALPGG